MSYPITEILECDRVETDFFSGGEVVVAVWTLNTLGGVLEKGFPLHATFHKKCDHCGSLSRNWKVLRREVHVPLGITFEQLTDLAARLFEEQK